MKKFFVLVGLIAIGASSSQAQYTPGLTPMESAKFWTLSGSVRGFYDDNYTTLPTASAQGSFGIDVSPSVAIHLNPTEATLFSASALYDMRWYENRVTHTADHTVQLNAKLDHAFSEKYKGQINESFVIAQEPLVLASPGTPTSTFLRTDGSNIRNTASTDFTADLTQNAGLEFAYVNTFYDYKQHGAGNRSALLDRMEHLASINLRWRFAPETLGIFGYQYGMVNFNEHDDSLYAFGPFVDPKTRDSRSHYLYVGADQSFNPQLNGSIRVGAQLMDYYQLPASKTIVNPYVDGSLTYTYAAGSYGQIGIKHMHNATDVAATPTSSLVLDQESTAAYLTLSHKITADLTGSLLAQYQHSEFTSSVGSSGESENYFTGGVNLAYQINPHFLAEAGYNFDRLDSDLGRSYTRNRVYIGIRATY